MYYEWTVGIWTGFFRRTVENATTKAFKLPLGGSFLFRAGVAVLQPRAGLFKMFLTRRIIFAKISQVLGQSPPTFVKWYCAQCAVAAALSGSHIDGFLICICIVMLWSKNILRSHFTVSLSQTAQHCVFSQSLTLLTLASYWWYLQEVFCLPA